MAGIFYMYATVGRIFYMYAAVGRIFDTHATAVTPGWTGYQNKSQHRKLTMEKNIFLLLLGIKPATF